MGTAQRRPKEEKEKNTEVPFEGLFLVHALSTSDSFSNVPRKSSGSMPSVRLKHRPGKDF
jgi:hypothetical protein